MVWYPNMMKESHSIHWFTIIFSSTTPHIGAYSIFRDTQVAQIASNGHFGIFW